MRYEFISKNITVTDGLKDKITAKLDKLERIIHEDNVVRVVLSLVKQENTVEVTIQLNSRTLRAQAKNEELMAAVDEVVDI
ncbi:MAG: ribosome-associated translation inhibitor RaiA, partial [Defluviitaleaceae bacterium]|nr:ribosome-associated translation inhibitor RaiA [Defluviitaleaceae bacterium]